MFSSREEAAGYVAGMIDGEGHVTVRSRGRYDRAVFISNTEWPLIEATSEALALLEVPHRIQPVKTKATRKSLWHVVVRKRDGFEKLSLAVVLRHPTKAARLREIVASYRPRPSREILEQLYVFEQRSCESIGTLYGMHRDTVRRLMDEYDIPRRSPSERNAVGHRNRV